MRNVVQYADVVIKQQIETWGEGLDFDPSEQIFLLLDDKFGVTRVRVEEVAVEGKFITFRVITNLWSDPKEFGLSKSGSLFW